MFGCYQRALHREASHVAALTAALKTKPQQEVGGGGASPCCVGGQGKPCLL